MNASDREKADTVDTLLKPLISVIVPIYNVEKYVRKCLDSLHHQSMKQIEIIAIDDGSTDESGKIADEYCNTDEDGNGNAWPIFRVIHTENRGLSAARNRGIDEARAEWLMFVDSDDWVDERFCENPWKAKEENDVDMVIFGRFHVSEKGKVKIIPNPERPSGLITKTIAYEYGNAAWKRICRRSLYSGIRYPEGCVYEDIAVTHKLIHAANRIAFLDNYLYYHTNRRDSIIQTHTYSNQRDRFIASLEKFEDLVSWGYSEEKAIEYATVYQSAIGLLLSTLPSEDELYVKAEKIVDSINGVPRNLSRNQKIALTTYHINTRLFYFLSKITGRMRC